MTKDMQLIEPVPIEDDLCTGIAMIEEIDGVGARLVLHAKQTCYESGSQVLVVKRKIVLPMSAIAPAIEALQAFRAQRVAGCRQGLQLVGPGEDKP